MRKNSKLYNWYYVNVVLARFRNLFSIFKRPLTDTKLDKNGNASERAKARGGKNKKQEGWLSEFETAVKKEMELPENKKYWEL